MRVLLTGASGQLGQAVQEQAGSHIKLGAFASSKLDITQAAQVERMLNEFGPDVVINAAAYTQVDKAESDIQAAQAVNVDGVGHLARTCQVLGAHLIHVSTDFVFDGEADQPYTPTHATNPQSVYGRSKRDGERLALELLGSQASIVRTSWLYGPGGQNFVTTMLRLFRQRPLVRVVDDQQGSPSCTLGLAQALLCMASEQKLQGGLYHWSDQGETSWFGFASEILRLAQARNSAFQGVQLEPISTAEYPTPASRPGYSVLQCSMPELAGMPAPRPWQQALSDCFERLLLQ